MPGRFSNDRRPPLSDKDRSGALIYSPREGPWGDVVRIVENKHEKKRYMVVSRGGLLGFFEALYAVPVERLSLKNELTVVNVTEEELTQMAFTDDSSYRTLDGGETINIPKEVVRNRNAQGSPLL